jgi:hypothetical protein
MDNVEYQLYDLQTFIGRYAALAKKPLVYFRVYGWNNSTDVDAINSSIAIYNEMLPVDYMILFKDSEHVVLELEEMGDVMNFLQDSFPAQQEGTPTEQYIFYALYNDEGQVILDNE